MATSFLAPDDLVRAGLAPDAVEVEEPFTAEESMLRPSLLAGLLRAVAASAGYRRPDVCLFEIGHIFRHRSRCRRARTYRRRHGRLRRRRGAVQIWNVLADGLQLADVSLDTGGPVGR